MYRNITYRTNPNTKEGEIVLFTWDKDGIPITEIHPHISYLFYEDRRGTYESIFGSKLIKKEFLNSYDRRRWTDNYKDMKFFEMLPPVREFLLDHYEGQQEEDSFRQFPLRVQYFDIEIAVTDSFPNPSEAKFPINAISVYDSTLQKFFVWTLCSHNVQDFKAKIEEAYSKETKLLWKLENVEFFNYNKECDLLLSFLNWFQNNYPDILTGWNVAKFDIPYLVNRMKYFFEKTYTRLSPVDKIYAKKMKMKNAETERDSFVIEGISVVDYLELYKYKFPPKNKPPSFKLDAVAEAELKYKKLDYEGTIRDFYKKDFYRFILYNIQDTYLVFKLDEKLKFINLTRIICNIGLTEYETILKSSPYIFGALALEARKMNKKIISNNVEVSDGNDSYEGAYVFPIQVGKFEGGVSSLDFNSLYPNIMIALNISPETKIGKILQEPNENSKDYVLRLKNYPELKTLPNLDMFKDKVVLSSNKVLYVNPLLKKGLVPIFLERMQDKRKEAKKKMLEFEDKLQKFKKVKNPSAEVKYAIDKLSTLVTLYHHLQNAFKVFSNSLYGQMGSPYFPLFDVDNAEAITLSGQHLIKEMAIKIDSELAKYDKNPSNDPANRGYICGGDTDSIYLDCNTLVHFVLNGGVLDSHENIKKVCEFLDKEFVPSINDYCFEVVKRDFYSPLKRIEFKRETLCREAYFLAKKHYVLHIINDEGVDVDKFKYTGVDVKKTEIPEKIKDVLKYVIENSLKSKWSNEQFRDYIIETWNKFKNMPREEVAFWKGYNTEKEEDGFFQHSKGAGPHAKGAIYYNNLIKQLKISDQHDEIRVGDRLRYVFINKNNPYNIEVIAWKDKYPKEFEELFEIDYSKMFRKIVLAPLESFMEINHWNYLNPADQAIQNILDL